MKFSPLAIALSGALTVTPTSSQAEISIPWSIVACYKWAVNDLFEKPLSESLVRSYVNPDEVIEYLKIPEKKQKPWLEEKVIQSVLSFAAYVKQEIQKREWTVSESELVFTFYKVYSTKIVLKGEIDNISFKVTLEPDGECKVLDFTLEWVKWMLDRVPRG